MRKFRRIELQDEAIGPVADRHGQHARRRLGLNTRQSDRIGIATGLRGEDLGEGHLVPIGDADPRRDLMRTGALGEHPHIADGIGADREQQAELVVSAGLHRCAQGSQPPAFGEQPGEVRRDRACDGSNGRVGQGERRRHRFGTRVVQIFGVVTELDTVDMSDQTAGRTLLLVDDRPVDVSERSELLGHCRRSRSGTTASRSPRASRTATTLSSRTVGLPASNASTNRVDTSASSARSA